MSCNDWRVYDELNELVEKLVQKADAGVQQSPPQCSHAGLQLALHVSFGYDHVFETEREGVLLQNIHQSEELIQVGVLREHPQVNTFYRSDNKIFLDSKIKSENRSETYKLST